MSSVAMPAPAAVSGWDVWRNQIASILFVELRKNFITKRGFWIYLLALAPPAIIWMHSIVALRMGASHGLEKDNTESFLNARQTEDIAAIVFRGQISQTEVAQPAHGVFDAQVRSELLQSSILWPAADNSKFESLVKFQ